MRKFTYIVLAIGIIVLSFVGTLYLLRDVTIAKIETTNIIDIQRPTYDYLRSITVYIAGEIPEIKKENNIIPVRQIWGGTGTIIKIDKEYTYILTNRHIAGEGQERVILFVEDDLKMVEAEIVALHENDMIDLAVIKIEGKLKGKRAVKGINIAYPQDRVYLVGHHLGRRYVYGEGVFAGYDDIYDIIQIPVLYGNSGTAVCNENGELVAVIYAINRIGFFDVDVSHGLAIDGLNVKIFLNKLRLL